MRIDAEEWYDETALRAQGMDGQLLARARRRGELRYRQLGRGLVLYRGQWLIDWLNREEGDTRDADER